ncbi:MAG: (2Fe-2S) ferredoxin domain-containing protein [Cyanobacteria bacterium P01_A01_bin.135]
MTISPPETHRHVAYTSRAQVLTGQYVGILRSPKGKIKGLWLRCGDEQHAITLPKYLRPMLVRELQADSALQVWALLEEGGWRAINIVPSTTPLPTSEAALPQANALGKTVTACLQICGKGKCAKQGSWELERSLQAELAANPDLQHVSVQMVGCMKACKQGPNLRVASTGQVVHRANPSRARAALAQALTHDL